MSQITESLSLFLPHYHHSHTQYDSKYHALWQFMHAEPRPVFTLTVLQEILDVQARVKRYLSEQAGQADDVRYLILASSVPDVFSLGGDLALFADLIRNQDREHLLAYGQLCVECVFNNHTHLGIPHLTTIALVQGSALGGGFEAALSSNVLVAERSASMGLPEILFNLFPGMGAYSLLARRLDMVRAERFMSSGRQYGAEELYEMGIVDVLAEDGQGVHAVNQFMRKHARSSNGLQAIRQVRERLAPLLMQELQDVVTIWVDAALRLTDRDLRTMGRLVAAQRRLTQRQEEDTLSSEEFMQERACA